MSNVFYITCPGISYMDITEDEWKFLEDKNTLTFTRVPYGSRKFKYYMSIEREALDKSVLTYMAELGYLDTKLLLSIPESIILAKQLGFEYVKQIIKENFYFLPSRRPWFTDEDLPPHKFKECRAKSFREPIFRYRGQLTATVNCALLLGATEIRLIAADFTSCDSFYNHPEYLNKLCKSQKVIDGYMEYIKGDYVKNRMQEKRDSCQGFDESKTHTTDMQYIEKEKWGERKLRGITDVLQWMDKELKEEGLEGIYVTNKNSMLFKKNKLGYKSIMEN